MATINILRLSPTVLRRLLVVGTGAVGGMTAKYNGVQLDDVLDRLRAAEIVMKSAGFNDLRQALKSFNTLRGYEDQLPISLALALQLSSSSSSVDFLWRHWNDDTNLLIPSLTLLSANASHRNIAFLLSRCPSIKTFASVVRGSGLSSEQLSEILLAYKPTRSDAPARLDLDEFIQTCQDQDGAIPADVFLFFSLTHSDAIPAASISQVIDGAIQASQRDMAKSKFLLLKLIDALFPSLASDDVRKLISVLIRGMGNAGTVEIANMCVRLLRKGPIEIDATPIIGRLLDSLQKCSQDELILLELVNELLRCDKKLTIPEDTQHRLLREYLLASTPAVKKRLLLGCLSSPSLLLPTVVELERIVGVTDYELSRRKQAIDEILNRPIVDSELYSFHEESDGAGNPIDSRDGDDVASTVQRIAILTDMMRHIAIERGVTDSIRSVSELLLLASFGPIFSHAKNSTSIVKDNLVLRACANISSLSRFASIETRDKFTSSTKSLIGKLDRTGLSVHAQAELGRLEYNVRCLPIKSAPLLIDSLLPLAASTPTDSDIDFVFVHGLRGGLYTWRVLRPPGADVVQLWPALCLGPSFPAARLLAFTFEAPLWYATHKQHYSEVDVKKNFDEMALSLRTALKDAGVGRDGKRVVFVTFSMGGLVVKRALVDDEQLRRNTAGVVFFATPHLGSPIADYAYYAPLGNLVSPFVADLSRKSKQVAALHEAFTNLCKEIPVLAICETAPTDISAGLKAMIVPYDSCAACSHGSVISAADGVDHDSVAKIDAELMEKDPRIVALIEFLRNATVRDDGLN